MPRTPGGVVPTSQSNLDHRHDQRSREARGDHGARDYWLLGAGSPRESTDEATKSSRKRNWVIAGIAAVLVVAAGYFWASETLVDVSAEEGTWKLVESRYSIGQQGSVFLTNDMGRVLRSYPMPGGPPTWIVVGQDYVYAGRRGDGGVPDSGLVRIDRDTLEATFMALSAPLTSTGREWPDDWLVASPDQVERYFSLVGLPEHVEGVEATSWVGPTVVDIRGLDELIEQAGG